MWYYVNKARELWNLLLRVTEKLKEYNQWILGLRMLVPLAKGRLTYLAIVAGTAAAGGMAGLAAQWAGFLAALSVIYTRYGALLARLTQEERDKLGAIGEIAGGLTAASTNVVQLVGEILA